jgi:hypothetical protein
MNDLRNMTGPSEYIDIAEKHKNLRKQAKSI